MRAAMAAGVAIINPDTFLETPSGRVWTPERSKAAWDRCFQVLEDHLRESTPSGPHRLLIVCGLQGAGKSHWIRQNAQRYAPCICFDAALPGIRHRRPILELASRYSAEAMAVWIDTPLSVALTRNALRAPDKRVPEDSVRSVAALFEPPSAEEGYSNVLRLDGSTPAFHPVPQH